MELRRVRGVGVGAVYAAGDHHVQRRRVCLHRAHLHRRGVRAQDELLGRQRRGRLPGRRLGRLEQVGTRYVEGVSARPRGVRRAVIERVEVVADRLDLRPLHHRETEPEEDVFQLAAHRRQQVQAPNRLRRRPGQRDVDAVGRERVLQLLAVELLGTLLDQRLQRLASLVCGLAHRAALLGRQLRDAAQHLRQLGLAPEVAHAQLLQRLGCARRGDLRLGLHA